MKNNNKNSKGSMIILTIIGIATLLVAVIGATFAYFTATVKYNDVPRDVVTVSGNMIVEFASKNKIDYTGAIPGRPAVYDEEGNLLTNNRMQFKLTSGENMSVPTTYDIYLKITENEFLESKFFGAGSKKTNLVYFLKEVKMTDSKAEDTNKKPNVLGSITSSFDLLTYDKFNQTKYNSLLNDLEIITIGDQVENNTVEVGIIPVTSDIANCTKKDDDGVCMLKISENAVIGNYEAANEWYFEIWLYETGDVQNEDQGKRFKATIELETDSPEISNEITP